MNVPEEFTYVPAVPPTPIVVKRQAFELRNSKDSISMTGDNSFEFRINQRTFVDLKSFYLSFQLHLHFSTNQAEKVANKRNRLSADGYHLFREIILRNEAGTVIERIEEAGVLAEIYKNLFASPSHLNTHGQVCDSSSNNVSNLYGLIKSDNTLVSNLSHQDAYVTDNDKVLSQFVYPSNGMHAWRTNSDENEMYTTYHCSILKLLGFFQTGKVIRPSTFGGLTLEFKLHTSPYEVLQLDNLNVTNSITPNFYMRTNAQSLTNISLSAVKLIFDECIVDSAYEQYYNDNYDTRGFRLDIETVDHTSVTYNEYNAMQSLRVIKIPFSVSNARALTTVVRPSGVTSTYGYRNTTFLPPSLTKNWRYQFVNMGGRYPLVPIESFVSNIQEVNKFKRQTQTLTQDTMYTLNNIRHPFSVRPGSNDGVFSYPQQFGVGGRFMFFAHLERVLNSRYTGIPLDSNSLVLELDMGMTLADAEYNDVPINNDGTLETNSVYTNVLYKNSGVVLDSYVLYTSSVYVMNGQISVTK